MSFEHDADPPALYDDLRRAFTKFMAGRSHEELVTHVPATPEWTVADVLAHLVGIPADLNHGRFPNPANPEAWTAEQVEVRRGQPVAALAAEWDAEAPTFMDGLRAFGYAFGSHYLGDLLHHVADVRHALGMTAPGDDEILVVALDFYLESFDETLREAGAGTVELRTGGEMFTAGDGPVIAALEGPRYEVFRALGGRRSERQIRNMKWTGDVDGVVPIVSRYPLPERDLVENTE